MQPLTARFKNFLIRQNHSRLAKTTLKNYVSDVEVFLTWLSRQLQETAIWPVHLSRTVFTDYFQWLNRPENQIRPNTIERYCSSLKRFGEFLLAEKLTETNPTIDLKPDLANPTLEQIIINYRNSLKRQNLSASTIKNYLSDLKQYLLWAKTQIKLTDSKIIQL